MSAIARLTYRETAPEYARMVESAEFPRWAILSGILTPVFRRARMRADEVTAEASGSRIAPALKVYEGRYRSYPATLDELGAKLGRKLPKDLFSGRDFVYRREGKGFLLYSIGGSLQDDRAQPAKEPALPVVPGTQGKTPPIPEPYYGDDPKYGDIIRRM